MHRKDQTPRVSIVMPFYNHGDFIQEAIDSIEKFEDSCLYEIVIINDGSTDLKSLEKLKKLEKTGRYKIIHQDNQGVCSARNNAILNSNGEYILPVDSDNKIRQEFITEAMHILNNDSKIAVVYSDYQLFGREHKIQKSGAFNLQRLMLDNFIENCSMYRKCIFDEIGGYDLYFSRIGIEDWEFWLRIAFAGYQFHYLEKVMFDYRVSDNSRTNRLVTDKSRGDSFIDYAIEKHSYYFGTQYVDEYFLNKFRNNFIGFLGKIIMRLYFQKIYNKLVKQRKLRKYL